MRAVAWRPHAETDKNKFYALLNSGYVDELLYTEGDAKLAVFSPFNTLVCSVSDKQMAVLNEFESEVNTT